MELSIIDFLDQIKIRFMEELIVDGMLNGTGIRSKYEGGYIKPEEIGLPDEIASEITSWLSYYEQEHYSNYSNEENIERLDSWGVEITRKIRDFLKSKKVTYFSNARLEFLTM